MIYDCNKRNLCKLQLLDVLTFEATGNEDSQFKSEIQSDSHTEDGAALSPEKLHSAVEDLFHLHCFVLVWCEASQCCATY